LKVDLEYQTLSIHNYFAISLQLIVQRF